MLLYVVFALLFMLKMMDFGRSMGRTDPALAEEYKADLLYAKKIRDGLVAEATQLATVPTLGNITP